MLTIATINVQNKYKLKKYNGIYEKEDHIKMLLSLIKKYNLDIIGLQEVNQRYFERLQVELPKNTSIYGKFRYPKNWLTKNLYPFSTFNESVPIITTKKIIKQETKVLPWLTSYVPRIVTIIEIETKELGPIVVLNTHLDYMKNKTKVKQLKKLESIISKIKKPIILMGDFNMTIKNKDFQIFKKQMEKLNIIHPVIDEATFKNAKQNLAIDHIFLSTCFNIENIILEKSVQYNNFSDHYPIIFKISINNI